MTVIYILLLLLLAGVVYTLYWSREYRKQTAFLSDLTDELMHSNKDIKNTLLIGLYNRFKCGEGEENPYDFEKFVASLLEKYHSGSAYVTAKSNDYGIDIELKRDKDLYLGQVKCQNEKVDFKPIAIIHSQMVKQKSKGGFVVTTSDFTQSAHQYAEGLNIELINGPKLIDIWASTLQQEKEKTAKLIPQEA